MPALGFDALTPRAIDGSSVNSDNEEIVIGQFGFVRDDGELHLRGRAVTIAIVIERSGVPIVDDPVLCVLRLRALNDLRLDLDALFGASTPMR
jgi:hypothetical protein